MSTCPRLRGSLSQPQPAPGCPSADVMLPSALDVDAVVLVAASGPAKGLAWGDRFTCRRHGSSKTVTVTVVLLPVPTLACNVLASRTAPPTADGVVWRSLGCECEPRRLRPLLSAARCTLQSALGRRSNGCWLLAADRAWVVRSWRPSHWRTRGRRSERLGTVTTPFRACRSFSRV